MALTQARTLMKHHQRNILLDLADMKDADEEGTIDPHGFDVKDFTQVEVEAYHSFAGPVQRLSDAITPKKTQDMIYQVSSRL